MIFFRIKNMFYGSRFIILFWFIVIEEMVAQLTYRQMSSTRFDDHHIDVTGIQSSIVCCAYCEEQGTCLAVNYNKELRVCELLLPSNKKPYPKENNITWNAYYKRLSDIDYKADAIAEQSSTVHSGDASNAVDDLYILNWTPDGRCTHTDYDTTNWLLIDFKRTYSVKNIVIWNREHIFYYELNNLVITTSRTIADIDTIVNRCGVYVGPPASVNDNPITITCSKTMEGRFLKISKTVESASFLTVCEIDLI